MLDEKHLSFMEYHMIGVEKKYNDTMAKFENSLLEENLIKESGRLFWLTQIVNTLLNIRHMVNDETKEIIDCLYFKGMSLEETINNTNLKKERILRQHYFITSEVYDVLIILKPNKKSRTKRKTIPLKERLIIYDKFNYACDKCHSENELHIHHIKSVAKGGTNNINNLQLLCRKCHAAVHKYDSAYHLLK